MIASYLTANNEETLNIKTEECTSLITESKEIDIAEMSAKLDDPKTALKTNSSIIDNFLE